MKYCIKCGTLLEDSQNRCIGCGSDVTAPESWSLYPPEVAKSIEIEKKETKSRTGLIIALVAVFVLLVAAITLFIVFYSSASKDTSSEATTQTVETISDENEVQASDAADSSEEAAQELFTPELKETDESARKPASGREIIDSEGRYYNFGSISDALGETVFTTIYPEDFSEIDAKINYDIYSTKYPESITYIVGNNDGNVRMTYISPQHYWYRKSDIGKTRDNERDTYAYMQFYKYSGIKGYIEAIIKDSYSDIKGFKFIGVDEYSPDVTTVINEVSNDQTMALLGDIGDYGKIAEDTVYAAMGAECEANIYHYQATSRQNNTIYMDFYVPVIANTLEYVTELDDDKGELIEWLIPEFVAFEAGNEELYELYSDAYKLFIANSKPNERFLYTNKAYSDELEAEIAAGKMPESNIKLDANKLKELNGKYSSGADLGQFGNGIYKLLSTEAPEYVTFKLGDSADNGSGDNQGTYVEVTGLENAKIAFYSREKNKVFISPADNEYPGDEYEELSR